VNATRLQRVGKQLEDAAREVSRVPSRTMSREEIVKRIDAAVTLARMGRRSVTIAL
jgi:hypothetical protein